MLLEENKHSGHSQWTILVPHQVLVEAKDGSSHIFTLLGYVVSSLTSHKFSNSYITSTHCRTPHPFCQRAFSPILISHPVIPPSNLLLRKIFFTVVHSHLWNRSSDPVPSSRNPATLMSSLSTILNLSTYVNFIGVNTSMEQDFEGRLYFQLHIKTGPQSCTTGEPFPFTQVLLCSQTSLTPSSFIFLFINF